MTSLPCCVDGCSLYEGEQHLGICSTHWATLPVRIRALWVQGEGPAYRLRAARNWYADGHPTPLYTMPLYAQAADLLITLSGRVYDRAMRAPSRSRAERECSRVRLSLQSLAHRFKYEEATRLDEQDHYDLREAIELIHEIEHWADFAPAPSVEECDCTVSQTILQLVGLLVAAGIDQGAHHAAA
ncbi:MAG TPA: hypothetical protein VHW46_09830 [Terracidiphilus sp.]|jgi:hypothetical protein|nr:hypothetical protein [Terracidiphilus sp.]